ncbi:MAG TPA: outer membrane beta-barrel protein [Nitrospirota bacterium]|nr:outer membrane beta-barrel protein [Nitrospirota bacterium]
MKKSALIGSIVVLVLLAGMALPGAVLAQGPGFYIGVGAGRSEIDSPGDYSDFDDTDTAIKAFVGYAINKGFALEAGYADLGSYAQNPDPAEPTIRSVQEAKAKYLAGVGIMPLSERIGLFAKIGIAMWDFDVTLSDPLTPGVSLRGSSDGVDTMFAIGFQFDLKPLLICIEYEQYQDVGDGLRAVPLPPDPPFKIDGTDVDVFGLSVAFMF